MSYPPNLDDDWVPCAPVFVEVDGGFELTDSAREALAALDPSPAGALSAWARIADVRAQLAGLVAALPGEVRGAAPADLLDAVQTLQHCVNVLGACDQIVVSELDRQAVHETAGATSTADLLVQTLRVRPSEAARRVRTARGCTDRVEFDGTLLPPVRPQVAAAQAAGTITPDHAAVIDRALDHLPTGLATDTVDAVEATLVELAGKRHPSDVALAGRAAREMFDPDGPEPRDDQQRRRRDLRLTVDDDGVGTLRGTLTPTLTAKLLAVLDPLAAPRPDDANGPDVRRPEQRTHDALEDVCDRLLRSGTLPDSGGVPATVAVTITADHLLAGTGRARTDLGVDLSVPQLLDLACEAEIIPVVLNDAGGIMSHGRSKRFATAAQTKALRARDRGCSFPGCRRPPQWCERHHVEQWLRDHGDTDIDTMCLLCSYHHRMFEQWGWQVIMKDGVPWWIPPAHLDPEQRPVQNHAHHDAEITFAAV